MVRSVTPIAETLAVSSRVLLLGGLAIIYHGLPRLTKDVDIWLEPGPSVQEWADRLIHALAAYGEAYLWDLSTRQKIHSDALVECIEAVGVVRIGGLESDLDVFRRPNNLELGDFEEAWNDSLEMPTGRVRVLDPSYLMATKLDTGRQSDQDDIAFLETKIRVGFASILQTCGLDDARRLFARYADQETCRAALRNRDPGVRALAVETLRELAASQNPFAREMLAELGEG